MHASLTATGPLSIPAFRRLWLGNTISVAGDAASWISLVALSLHAAHSSLPVLVALYTAPVAVGGLVAGWALDRFDRRRLMVTDQLIRAAVFASLPITAIFASVTAAQLYFVATVYGMLKMFSLAGVPSLIPSLVPSAHLQQANALEGTSFGLASLTGAAIAGIGIATIGAANVVACDAISYLILAVTLLSLRRLMPSPGISALSPSTSPRLRVRADRGFTALVRLVTRDPILRNTTVMFALFNVGEGMLLVLLPHRAVTLSLGPGGYGYLVAASTVGELTATALLASRSWKTPLRAAIVSAQLLAAVVVLALAVDSAVTTVLALIALGFISAPMTAWAQTLRMSVVPADLHGRLFALLRTAMQATPPLGAGLTALLRGSGTTITFVLVSTMIGVPAALLGPGLLNAHLGGTPQPPD